MAVDVKGPLDVLRHTWTMECSGDQNVVSYVLLMREKMEKMADLVQENLQKAKHRQKTRYDRNARERFFHPGDYVLVRMPTSPSKLAAQWQGPYRIVGAVGKVNYRVYMHDRRKRERIFHVNMLQKWHSPSAALLSQEVETDSDNDDIPTWNDTAGGQAKQGSHLSDEQAKELDILLARFESLFTALPGHTTLVEHHVTTGDAKPVRLRPYRIPQAFQESVKQELAEMLKHGIIEPSTSSWAFP